MEQKPEPEKICTECGHKLPANYFDNSDKCYLCDVEPTNKPEAPMTWQQCCEQIAIKHGLGKSLVIGHKPQYFHEAAELYAESQFNRGAREQREICIKTEEAGASVKHAPAPEFKA